MARVTLTAAEGPGQSHPSFWSSGAGLRQPQGHVLPTKLRAAASEGTVGGPVGAGSLVQGGQACGRRSQWCREGRGPLQAVGPAREARLCLWLSLQYDWCSWIPNAPPTMRAPPPTAKGVVTIEQIVDTLPDRGRSCWHLGAVWALSQFQENEVSTGDILPLLKGRSLGCNPFLRLRTLQPKGLSWTPALQKS